MPDETPSTGSEPAPATVPPAGEVPGQRPPSDPETPAPPAAETPAPPAAPGPPAAESPAPPAPPAPPAESAPAESAPAESAPAEDAPAPAKRARRLVGTLVFGGIVLVLLGAIGYVLYHRFSADPTRDAMAGDCLADLPIVAVGEDQEVSSARVVACDDPAATFMVEGRLDSLSDAQASAAEICQAYEEARFIYRAVPRGGTGYVLCLRQLAE